LREDQDFFGLNNPKSKLSLGRRLFGSFIKEQTVAYRLYLVCKRLFSWVGYSRLNYEDYQAAIKSNSMPFQKYVINFKRAPLPVQLTGKKKRRVNNAPMELTAKKPLASSALTVGENAVFGAILDHYFPKITHFESNWYFWLYDRSLKDKLIVLKEHYNRRWDLRAKFSAATTLRLRMVRDMDPKVRENWTKKMITKDHLADLMKDKAADKIAVVLNRMFSHSEILEWGQRMFGNDKDFKTIETKIIERIITINGDKDFNKKSQVFDLEERKEIELSASQEKNLDHICDSFEALGRLAKPNLMGTYTLRLTVDVAAEWSKHSNFLKNELKTAVHYERGIFVAYVNKKGKRLRYAVFSGPELQRLIHEIDKRVKHAEKEGESPLENLPRHRWAVVRGSLVRNLFKGLL